jgi:hypothetical protein
MYTVPTGMRAIIDCISYYNTSASANTVLTYVNDGTQRTIDNHSVGATVRYIAIDKNAPLYLDAGYILLASDGVGAEVNYHVFGQLEQKG